VCSLEELDLSSNAMNDEGAAALVDLLAGMITLKCLKFTDCNFITTDGWRLIAGLLQTNWNVMSLD
jgi:Ran GTPase-activating protein (RanGAP) involved in mRNA processing and transport